MTQNNLMFVMYTVDMQFNANPIRTLECLTCFIAATCFYTCINIYCYLRLS